MKLEHRKMVAKIKPIHKIAKYIMYNSGRLFFIKVYREMNLKPKFDKLRGSSNNKRCFIVGNGASLSVNDLNRLVNEDCFAANEIYKIFPQTEWRPKYYLIQDRYSKTSAEVVDKLDIENIFLGDYYLRYNKVERKDIICVHQKFSLNDKKVPFSEDIEKCIYNAPTVVYGLMQIAIYIGYKEIYLIGLDHNYSYEFDKKGNVKKTGKVQTHFFKDDVPEDIIANVYGMTKAYESFREYAIRNNIMVYNATRGGKLEIFKRIELEEIFEK